MWDELLRLQVGASSAGHIISLLFSKPAGEDKKKSKGTLGFTADSDSCGHVSLNGWPCGEIDWSSHITIKASGL